MYGYRRIAKGLMCTGCPPASFWVLLLLPIGSLGCGLCRGMKIHVLDLNSLAPELGYPGCKIEEKAVVDARLGIVYLQIDEHHPDLRPHRPDYYSVHHQYGTHSAPYLFVEALKKSNCHTDSMDDAELIYIDDYCYYTWWLASIHSLGPDTRAEAGKYLLKGWRAVVDLPRFNRSQGQQFILYDPHPGFANGEEGQQLRSLYCNELRHVVHLLVDVGQRSWCNQYWKWHNIILTPNNPSVTDINSPWLGSSLDRPRLLRNDRHNLLFFVGKCNAPPPNPGKKFRLMTYLALNATQPHRRGVSMQCTDIEGGDTHIEFDQSLHIMERSKFCLVLPGCIPVFIGPPYNSMPLAGIIDYRSAGIFFNVTNTTGWLPQPAVWRLSETAHATHAQDARYWLPDVNIFRAAIQVDNLVDIIPHLEMMPAEEVDKKLELMERYRHHMTFKGSFLEPTTAETLIMKALCRKMRPALRQRQPGLQQS